MASAEPIMPIRKIPGPLKVLFVGLLMANLAALIVRMVLPYDWWQGETNDELPRDGVQALAAWWHGPDYDPRFLAGVQLVVYLLTGILLLAVVGSCATGGADSCLSQAQNEFPAGMVKGIPRMMGVGMRKGD